MQPDDLTSELFDEWAAAYARGERPDPRSFLTRAGAHRDALAALMDRFLQAAPRADPTAEDVELVAAWMRGDSPLAELRSRRGITRDQIVSAIQERFGLQPHQRAAIKDYYHQLESGLISPQGLSARLLEFLSQTLGVRDAVIMASRPRRLMEEPAFRAVALDAAAVDDVSFLRAHVSEPDAEVTALFLSDE